MRAPKAPEGAAFGGPRGAKPFQSLATTKNNRASVEEEEEEEEE